MTFPILFHLLTITIYSCTFVSRLCAILVLLVNVTYSMLFTHRHWNTVLLRSMLVYPGAQRWLLKQQGNTFFTWTFSSYDNKNVTGGFGFALLRSVIGWQTLTPFSQPMGSQSKTNLDMLARVFPRLAPVTCIYFEF